MPDGLTAVRGVAALLFVRALSLLWLIATPVHAAGLQGTGVVFLHGKGVWAGAFDGGIPAALEAEGAVATSPNMPWSLWRIYGATYEEAMQEIDGAVAGLKAKGATRIIIMGTASAPTRRSAMRRAATKSRRWWPFRPDICRRLRRCAPGPGRRLPGHGRWSLSGTNRDTPGPTESKASRRLRRRPRPFISACSTRMVRR